MDQPTKEPGRIPRTPPTEWSHWFHDNLLEEGVQGRWQRDSISHIHLHGLGEPDPRRPHRVRSQARLRDSS